MKKRRADERLMEEWNLPSLKLARALILEGRAFAGDQRIVSAGEKISPKEPIRVKGEIDRFVSRGAHKLLRALEAFEISVEGRVCVDVGASTGGFTDVMLRAGARRVYAVDVGYNLLDYRLRSDKRVTPMERTNARFLKPEDFPEKPSFGATDVSFISLKAVLPRVLPLLEGDQRRFVALIKPQFEAPRELVGEKGVVRDPAVHEQVLRDILEFVPSTGWAARGLDFSPIRGPEGNIEFLLDLCPAAETQAKLHENAISQTIRRAYDKFIKSPQ